MMIRFLGIIFILFYWSSFLKADVPYFDVIKLRIGKDTLYLQLESRGLLKHGDFCYYDYDQQYLQEVKSVVHQIFEDLFPYNIYRQLHRINIKNIPGREADSKNLLYAFKDRVEFTSKINVDSIEILSAENGNIYGDTFSEDLSESDNIWLTKYKIEKLFDFEESICNMTLFAIDGAVSNERKLKLQKAIYEAVNKNDGSLERELSRLYKQKIIMIGFCSC